MKQAYHRFVDCIGWYYMEIEVLPHCKSITKFDHTSEYQLVLRKLLGLIPWTYWLSKDDIRWFDAPSIKYYDCKSGGKDG